MSVKYYYLAIYLREVGPNGSLEDSIHTLPAPEAALSENERGKREWMGINFVGRRRRG